MTEKEKMLAHQWYDANFDKDLETERVRAKDLCFDFNQTRPSDDGRRQAILTELFGYTLRMSQLIVRSIQIMVGMLN